MFCLKTNLQTASPSGLAPQFSVAAPTESGSLDTCILEHIKTRIARGFYNLLLNTFFAKFKQVIIAVGSTNPAKIDPVKEVFSHYFKNIKVLGVQVSSGVNEQPLHHDEMYNGAYNRAKSALNKVKGASYGVGIEGGLHKYNFGWLEQTTIVIVNKKGEIGIGSSGGVVLPKKLVAELKKGKNLEQVMDSLFGTQNIGEGIGMFGLFTKGLVTRSSGVKHGVAFALSRFLHKKLYEA